MSEEEIDKIRKKYKTTKDNFIDEKYESIRLDISFVKDFETLLNYIDKLQKENEELKEDIESWKFTHKYVEENYVDKFRLKYIILDFIPQTIHEVEFKTKLMKLLGETKDEE